MKTKHIFLATSFVCLFLSCGNQDSSSKASSGAVSLFGEEVSSVQEQEPIDSLKVLGNGRYETPMGDTISRFNHEFSGWVDDTIRFADVQYQMYSRFEYKMTSCRHEDYISYAEHWSYQSLACPDTYPAEYAAFFERNPLAQIDSIYVTKSYLNWKDNVELKISPGEEGEDEDLGCYTTYEQENLRPYSLDTTIFVVVTSRDIYLGGAHGLPSISFANFDVQTGKIISLNDLLAVDDSFQKFYLDRLEHFCKEEYGDFQSEPLLTENVCIQLTGLNFLYQPYELMGFAAGMPEFFLSFDDLRPYLKINALTKRLLDRYNRHRE